MPKTPTASPSIAVTGGCSNEKWLAGGLFSLMKSNKQDLDIAITYGGVFGREAGADDRSSLNRTCGMAFTPTRATFNTRTEPSETMLSRYLDQHSRRFRFRP